MNDVNDYAFSDMLRGFRVRAQMSQQELATKLGKHRNSIGAWEIGSSLPKTRSLVVEIGRALLLSDEDVARLLDASLFSIMPRETGTPPQRQGNPVLPTQSHSLFRHDYYAHIPLPPNYIDRTEVLLEVRDKLLRNASSPALAPSISVLQGMAGIGKSVIARALCDDPAIQAAFPGGILWATFEPSSEFALSMHAWINMLGDTVSEDTFTVNSLVSKLDQLLEDHICLLILDDVWRRPDIELFSIGGSRCHVLITTRDAGIGYELGGQILSVPSMTPSEAIRLLDKWADGHLSETDPILKDEIANRLGYHPLAVKLAGAQLQDTTPDELLDAINRHGETPQRDGSSHSTLKSALRYNLNNLDEEDTYLLFIALAVFKEGEDIPRRVIERLWQSLSDLDTHAVDDLLHSLATRALLEFTSTHTVRLHDLMRNLVSIELGDKRSAIHQSLITAYRATCTGTGWHTASNDGYLYDHLAFHLRALSAANDFRDLFANQHWLHARVSQCNYAYDGYLEDLSYAWEYAYAEMQRQIEADLEPVAFVECIRYLLIRASINSIVSNYSPELIVRSVELGLWTPQKAVSIAETIPDPEKRAKTYIALLKANKLGKEQQEQAVRNALRVALKIQCYSNRTAILAELAPRLNKEELKEILKVPLAQTDEQERIQVLAALDPQLAKQQSSSWEKMMAQEGAYTQPLARENLRAFAESLPRDLDHSQIRHIRQTMGEFLQAFQHLSRQEIFQYYFAKEIFVPPIYSSEMLSAIASHIVEICEKWTWP